MAKKKTLRIRIAVLNAIAVSVSILITSIGIATFDPEIDKTVNDVIIHADHLMYENKRSRKKNEIK